MKTQTDTYVVSKNGEHGTFFVRSGERYGNTWLQLTINSTFGTFGYMFGAIGGTPASFLSDVGFDYLMGKLMGADAMVFDASTTAKSVKELIVRHRRRDDLSNHEARQLWDALEEAVDLHHPSEDLFFVALAEEPLFFDWEVWSIARRVPSPQAVGFWETLWPEFLVELRANAQVVAA